MEQEFKGSSPLVRGALHEPRLDAVQEGIIPARAGSTPHDPVIVVGAWDHPRSCGEHCAIGH